MAKDKSALEEYMTDDEVRQLRKAEATDEQFINDMKLLFKDKKFERFFLHLLYLSGYNTNGTVDIPFNENTNIIAFLAGRNSVGAESINLVSRIDPYFYPRLLMANAKENK